MHLLWTALLISFSSQRNYSVKGNPNGKPLDCIVSFYDHNVFHYYCNNIKIENLYIDYVPRPYTHLYFRNCSIRNVIQDAFYVVPNMVHLDLRDNYISSLPEQTFKNSSKLQYLDLSFNILQKLDGLLFENLVNLKYLNLSLNKLDILENTETFKSQGQLCNLSIAENPLKTLKKDVLKPLTALKTLDLRNNPFNCDCEFIGVVNWTRKVSDVPTFTCKNDSMLLSAKDIGFLLCNESQMMNNSLKPSGRISVEIAICLTVIGLIIFVILIIVWWWQRKNTRAGQKDESVFESRLQKLQRASTESHRRSDTSIDNLYARVNKDPSRKRLKNGKNLPELLQNESNIRPASRESVANSIYECSEVPT